MKIRTASIVTVIVSAVLILSGIIVCAVASASAKNEGIMIFPENENGESVFRYDFSDKDIERITLNAGKADIEVTHGGDRSFIEIRNFNANYYKLSVDETLLNFNEVDSIASMFKFWEGGFSFKGMRYLFRFGDSGSGGRRIVLNLSDTQALKSMLISSNEGNVSISEGSSSADYTINADTGNVSVTSLKTSKSLSVSSSGANVKINGCSFSDLSLSGSKGDVTLFDVKTDNSRWELRSGKIDGENLSSDTVYSKSDSTSISLSGFESSKVQISSESGVVELRSASPLTGYAIDLNSKNASVFMNDVHYEGSYSAPIENAEKSISVSTSSAPILLQSSKAE